MIVRVARYASLKVTSWINFFAPQKHSQFISVTNPDILIIAPGLMKIPPKGWGAVESVALKHKEVLEESGLRVSLLNSLNIFHWLKAFLQRPKVTICHYDIHLRKSLVFSRIAKSKLVSITHFGYAGFPNKWTKAYSKLVFRMAKSDLVICLSERIMTSLIAHAPQANYAIFNNRLEHLPPNGSHKKGAVCLGKIEPRKRQLELISLSSEVDVDIDFVGPIADNRITGEPLSRLKNYLGEWSQEEVRTKLGDYKVLVLASDGEADALVIHEALLSGLLVVATSAASGSFEFLDFNRVRKVSTVEELPVEVLEALRSFSPPSEEDLEFIARVSRWTDEAKKDFAQLVLSVL